MSDDLGPRDSSTEGGIRTVNVTTGVALRQAVAGLMDASEGDRLSEQQRTDLSESLLRAGREWRNANPRTAAVAFRLSDAMAFTELAEISGTDARVLRRGARLLLEPFIAGDDESALMRDMLNAEWTVTAALTEDFAKALGAENQPPPDA